MYIHCIKVILSNVAACKQDSILWFSDTNQLQLLLPNILGSREKIHPSWWRAECGPN